MKLQMGAFVLAFVVVLTSFAAVVSASETLSKWELVKPSKWSNRALRLPCNNLSEIDWVVSELDGRIVVEQGNFEVRPVPPPALQDQIAALQAQLELPIASAISSIWPIAKGWLVGVDIGEWGGALWVFGEDHRELRRLYDWNIRFMFRWGEGLYAAGGLAHLTLDYGVVLELDGSTPSDLSLVRTIDLPHVVIAFGVIDEETLLTVSHDGLIEIRKSGRIKTRSLGRWWGPYRPNSVVRLPTGEIYVGARYGIAKLVPNANGFTEEWLVPAPCQK